MLRRSFVLGSVALVSLATAAAGQSMAPLRLGVAVGPSFNRTSWEPWGAHGVLSLTSQSPGSRLAIRVEALFDGAQRIVPHNQGLDPARTQIMTIGLLVSPTYRLWGKRSGLYAIAGLGLYHSRDETQRLYGDRTLHQSSLTELGVNAGLGIDFTMFGRNAFVESRLHSAAFHDRVPLSLGIRF
jgi:hypothetical protein